MRALRHAALTTGCLLALAGCSCNNDDLDSDGAGDHDVDLAWGHGGNFIVLVDALDLVVVVTADPFVGEHSNTSWKHERAHLNLVGRFIASLE